MGVGIGTISPGNGSGNGNGSGAGVIVGSGVGTGTTFLAAKTSVLVPKRDNATKKMAIKIAFFKLNHPLYHHYN